MAITLLHVMPYGQEVYELIQYEMHSHYIAE